MTKAKKRVVRAGKTAMDTAKKLITGESLAKPESVLQEAERLINGPRRIDYGPAELSFRQYAVMASIATGKSLTPADVCKVMIAIKICREAQGHKRDSLADLAGYTGLLQQLNEEGVAHIEQARTASLIG